MRCAPRYHDWFEVKLIGMTEGSRPARHGPIEDRLLVVRWATYCVHCELLEELVASYLENKAIFSTHVLEYTEKKRASCKVC